MSVTAYTYNIINEYVLGLGACIRTLQNIEKECVCGKGMHLPCSEFKEIRILHGADIHATPSPLGKFDPSS
jgi:hypothetical protein